LQCSGVRLVPKELSASKNIEILNLSTCKYMGKYVLNQDVCES
jgi:hypothetical protein